MTTTPGRGFWDKVQGCDPRLLYVIFAALMVALQFFTVAIPAPVPPSVQRLYDLIERLPTDKIVIFDSSADAGWLAEARPTIEVVIRHLFRRGIPIAVCSNITFNQGQRIGTDITDRIAKEMGKEYGKDYCYWQAVDLAAGGGVVLRALAKDIPETIKLDINKKPIREIPMMKNVRDIKDVSLIYTVAYSWDYIPWIGFVQSVYGTPFAVGTASISSSSAYTFLDAGQLCGMVSGAAGSAAYDRLLDHMGSGTRIAAVQSFAVLYVVLAVILGNLAMLAARIEKNRKAG